ncbi:MAG: hypothetical protein U0892_08095 [Pirellulales bacterium]
MDFKFDVGIRLAIVALAIGKRQVVFNVAMDLSDKLKTQLFFVLAQLGIILIHKPIIDLVTPNHRVFVCDPEISHQEVRRNRSGFSFGLLQRSR